MNDICLKHGVKVIADEIHCELIMPGYQYTPFASISEACRDNCVVLNSPSKSFNIAGLHTLSPLEEAYFCRMMTFVLREQMISKVGETRKGVLMKCLLTPTCRSIGIFTTVLWQSSMKTSLSITTLSSSLFCKP